MVVLSSHTTPWACGNLDGIAVRRDICVSDHLTLIPECGDGSVGDEEGDLGGT